MHDAGAVAVFVVAMLVVSVVAAMGVGMMEAMLDAVAVLEMENEMKR